MNFEIYLETVLYEIYSSVLLVVAPWVVCLSGIVQLGWNHDTSGSQDESTAAEVEVDRGHRRLANKINIIAVTIVVFARWMVLRRSYCVYRGISRRFCAQQSHS